MAVEFGFFFLSQPLQGRAQIERFTLLTQKAAARQTRALIRILLRPLAALRTPMPSIRFPNPTK